MTQVSATQGHVVLQLLLHLLKVNKLSILRVGLCVVGLLTLVLVQLLPGLQTLATLKVQHGSSGARSRTDASSSGFGNAGELFEALT